MRYKSQKDENFPVAFFLFPKEKRALINAYYQFARLGGIHKNTFINSPSLLDDHLRLKSQPNLRCSVKIVPTPNLPWQKNYAMPF